MDDVTHLRMYGKVLALKLNSVQTNVDEHVQAIDRVKRNSVSRGKNGLDLGISRCNHTRAGRLNRHALAQKAGGKCLVIDLGQRNDVAEMGASSVRTRPRIPKDLRTLVNMLPLGHTNRPK